MKKIFSLLLMSLMCIAVSYSQGTVAKVVSEDKELTKIEVLNFGVEVGAHMFTNDVTPPRNVRLGAVNTHAYYIPWHIGATVEYLFANRMFGAGAGLRLTSYMAYLGRDRENSQYYQWNVDPDSDEGDYVDVHSIKQVNTYLGIPLQFRIFFVPQDKVVRPYFKMDLAFNLLVADKNTISFVDKDAPIAYIDKINEDLGTPEKFNSTLDFAYGLRIGKDPFYTNLEVHYPSFLLTDSPVSFFDASDLTRMNFGVRIALQVPIMWSDLNSKKRERAEDVQSEYIIDENTYKEQLPDKDDANGEFTPRY